MSPSSTNQPTPTMTELHTALGSLLELLADVPEVTDPSSTGWGVGYEPGDGVGIHATLYNGTPELLHLLLERLGGSVTRSHLVSGRRRMHEVHGSHSGVTVSVTAWLPEPTEREELLSALAELDAAEADTQGGAA